jgi:hypothetical protein
MSLESLCTSENFHEITLAEFVAGDFVIATYFGAHVLASRQIRCGVGGDLHVLKVNGVEETIHDVLQGESLQIAVTKVYADSTAEEISVFC